MFGFGVVLYLFLAGMGAGLYIASCFLERSFAGIVRPCRDEQLLHQKTLLIALILLCVGGLFLVLDLTVPEKMLLVFKRPFGSVISFGAWLITLLIIFLALRNIFWRLFALPHTTKLLIVRVVKTTTFLLACGVILYTGVFLTQLRAVSFWETLLITVLFSLSALSSGFALFCVLAVSSLRRPYPAPLVQRISQTDTVFVLLEVVFLALTLGMSFFGDPAAHASALRLLTGDLAWAFWVLLVGVGLIVPLAIDAFTHADQPFLLLVKGLSVCTGCFFLRYCIMEAGVRSFSLA